MPYRSGVLFPVSMGPATLVKVEGLFMTLRCPPDVLNKHMGELDRAGKLKAGMAITSIGDLHVVGVNSERQFALFDELLTRC